MLSKTVGKKCLDPACEQRELQDAGLEICPSCGGELETVTTPNRRAQALVVAMLVVLGSLSGVLGYGLMAKRLRPVRTAQWLLGRIELTDSLRPSDAREWLDGDAVFYNETGALPTRPEGFLYEVKDGRRTSTFREALRPNTLMRFSVTPEVPVLYLLHRGDAASLVLFPEAGSPAGTLPRPVVIPRAQLIQLQGGATTEHFIFVAARGPIPSLEVFRTTDPPKSEAVDSAIAALEGRADAYVLHVYIPHS